MKKIICFISIFSIVSNFIVINVLDSYNNIIEYADNQNTNTIVEVLQSLNINIPNSVHIEKIKYECYFHDFNLTITYMEDNEIRTTEKIVNGNNSMRKYFSDNSTNLRKEIEIIQKIYVAIYIILIIVIIVLNIKKRRKSKINMKHNN